MSETQTNKEDKKLSGIKSALKRLVRRVFLLKKNVFLRLERTGYLKMAHLGEALIIQ